MGLGMVVFLFVCGGGGGSVGDMVFLGGGIGGGIGGMIIGLMVVDLVVILSGLILVMDGMGLVFVIVYVVDVKCNIIVDVFVLIFVDFNVLVLISVSKIDIVGVVIGFVCIGFD